MQSSSSAQFAWAGKGATKDTPRIKICRRCGEEGHVAKECPTLGDPSYDEVKQKMVSATCQCSTPRCECTT